MSCFRNLFCGDDNNSCMWILVLIIVWLGCCNNHDCGCGRDRDRCCD